MIGRCDWCKRDGLELRKARDWEEGMRGPVYDVCAQCRQRQREEAEQDF